MNGFETLQKIIFDWTHLRFQIKLYGTSFLSQLQPLFISCPSTIYHININGIFFINEMFYCNTFVCIVVLLIYSYFFSFYFLGQIINSVNPIEWCDMFTRTEQLKNMIPFFLFFFSFSLPIGYSELGINCKLIFGSILGPCQHCVQFQVSKHLLVIFGRISSRSSYCLCA
jgi:hypothetical protein